MNDKWVNEWVSEWTNERMNVKKKQIKGKRYEKETAELHF